MTESKQEWISRMVSLYGLDDEDIVDLAELLIKDTKENLTVLDVVVEGNDLELATRAAHNIKGSAANVGQMALSLAASVIEEQLLISDLTKFSENLKALHSAFEDFLHLMSQPSVDITENPESA
jgi:HPt (histidine-containing phosphotransfer) domain-containing protein